MILIRLLLYMVVRIIGYEFWILPDIFDDALFPLYSFTRAEDDIWGYLFRVIILCFIGYLCYEVAKDPAVIKEYAESATQSHDDIVSWGRIKLGIDKVENPLSNAINYDKVLLDEEPEEANASSSSGGASSSDNDRSTDSNDGDYDDEDANDGDQDDDM
jgi:translocation protein SEC62